MFVILTFDVQSQPFEGRITYSVEFEMKGEFSKLKDQIFEKMINEGSYYDTVRVYIKNGKYKKMDNSTNQKAVIYSSEQNKIYSLQKGSEYVAVIDANKTASMNLNFPKPTMAEVDSIKFINGIPCGILKLSWENLGEEWYFFNKETAVVDPNLFAQHNYEYLNKVLDVTGSYPLEIVKSMNDAISIRMTLVSIDDDELKDDLFNIPELKKANRRMTKIMDRLTEGQVMQIK